MKRRLGLIAAVATSLALAGCTGGGSSSGDGGNPNEIRYLIAQPETPEQLNLIKSDLQKFEAQSGIKVDLETLPNDNLQTVLQTQLRSGEGPDVFDYGTGPGLSGVLADAGLLYDLTDAYQSRNWKIYPFAKERATFDGKALGIPANLEEFGIFYNKDLFAKLGVAAPDSLEALDAAAVKIKAAGITPLAVADKEGWEGGHLLSMALSSRVGGDKMTALVTGKEPWTSPDVVAALQVWSDFNQKGYLTKSPTAVSYDSATATFYAGKAAMVPTGSWMVAGMEKNAKFDVGFIPFPAERGKGIFSGGLGSGTFIAAKTSKVDAALKFLDHLQSPERGRWQVQNLQTIPAYPVDTTGIDVPPLFAQVLKDTGEISKGTGDFGTNIDVLTTDTFNKAMWEGIQGIFSGQQTPEQVAPKLEAAYKSGS